MASVKPEVGRAESRRPVEESGRPGWSGALLATPWFGFYSAYVGSPWKVLSRASVSRLLSSMVTLAVRDGECGGGGENGGRQHQNRWCHAAGLTGLPTADGAWHRGHHPLTGSHARAALARGIWRGRSKQPDA